MLYKVEIEHNETLIETSSAKEARRLGIEAYLTRVVVTQATPEDIEWYSAMTGAMPPKEV